MLINMTYFDETPPLIASYMGLYCSLIPYEYCLELAWNKYAFVDLLCITENANHPIHFPDVRLHTCM